MNIKDELQIYIKVMINTKKWLTHFKLPSEQKLANQFFCSRLTVRRAYQELVSKGYLYVEKGAGYFVKKKFLHDRAQNPRTELILFNDNQILNPTESFYYQNLEIIPAPKIDKYPGYIKKYYDPNNQPYQFIKSYVNPQIYPLLDKRAMKKSVSFAYLEKNIVLIHRKRIIIARPLNNQEKSILNYDSDETFTITYSILIDKNQKLIEFSVTYTKLAHTEIYCDQELS